MISLGTNKKTKDMVIHSDPFSKECIDNVHIFIRRSRFDESVISYGANIELINGNTKAKQRIEGADFNDLVEKMNTFINSL